MHNFRTEKRLSFLISFLQNFIIFQRFHLTRSLASEHIFTDCSMLTLGDASQATSDSLPGCSTLTLLRPNHTLRITVRLPHHAQHVETRRTIWNKWPEAQM